MQSVSVIIPAYNEESTIGAVIRAAREHPLTDEVIVVADGSTDRTAAVARAAGATTVLELRPNRGKGQAMDEGVQHARNDVIVFLDADIVGLTTQMISDLVLPVLRGERAMVTLQRDLWIEAYYASFSPLLNLSGQRCLRKTLWHSIPPAERAGYKIETALNYHAWYAGLPVLCVPAPGLRALYKEEKRGVVSGLYERCGAIVECTSAFVTIPLRHTYAQLQSKLIAKR